MNKLQLSLSDSGDLEGKKKLSWNCFAGNVKENVSTWKDVDSQFHTFNYIYGDILFSN